MESLDRRDLSLDLSQRSLGIVVSMLTGNWEGITPYSIFYCISCKVLNFHLLIAGNKWDIVLLDLFLRGNKFNTSRPE